MGSGLGRQTNSPADTEGEAANVGDDVVEPMVDTPPVLEVDIELSEFQLHVINIMQEEHEDAHVVVPTGKGNREGGRHGPPGLRQHTAHIAPRTISSWAL